MLENALFWLHVFDMTVTNAGWCMIAISNWLATCILVIHTFLNSLKVFYNILQLINCINP